MRFMHIPQSFCLFYSVNSFEEQWHCVCILRLFHDFKRVQDIKIPTDANHEPAKITYIKKLEHSDANEIS